MKTFFYQLALITLMSSCGAATSTLKSEAATPSPSSKNLYCASSYVDKGIQDKPLFDEGFEVDLSTGGVVKKFGVTPGDGEYFAQVAENRSEAKEVVLRIGNLSTGLSAIAMFSRETKQMPLILELSPSRTMSLSCVSQ